MLSTQFLKQDRNQKLDLTTAPAYRIALFQTREDTCEVVWTLSHVLLDGWSCAVVVNDWVKIYSDLVLEDESVTTPGLLLSEYTRWIGSQDKQAMLDYWDGYLPPEIQLCAEAFQASKAETSPAHNPVSVGSCIAGGICSATAKPSASRPFSWYRATSRVCNCFACQGQRNAGCFRHHCFRPAS